MHDRWDQAEMSPIEHLRELRTRLVRCVAAVGIAALALLWPSPRIIHWLVALYFPGQTLHAFSPTDVIGTEFRFSLFGGIVFALPIILGQIWLFIVPALHPRTRNLMYAYTFPAFVLAVLGILFCHFAVLPRVVGALLALTSDLAEITFGIAPTISLILTLFLAFALIFQTPVIMVALARIGLVNVVMLRKYRRHVFMATLVVGGVAAPDGSPLTMALLALPIYVLFEISIVVIGILEKTWNVPRSSDSAR
jgi:sec-independent protein translocase protein TatC